MYTDKDIYVKHSNILLILSLILWRVKYEEERHILEGKKAG